MKKMSIAAVVAVLLLGVAFFSVQKANANYSYFGATQAMYVYSPGNLSYTGMWDYNTSSWNTTQWYYGSYNFSYPLPYGAWFVVVCYSAMDFSYTEAVYQLDSRLH
jgi:hypothetical protein